MASGGFGSQRSMLIGGYDVEFIDRLSSDIEARCPVCLLVIRDPYHPVTCKCGTHFCKTCIEPIYKKKQPCPICKEHFGSIALNVQMKRTIENKKVYCTHKDDGCAWEGELRKLDSHLMGDSAAAIKGCEFYPQPCEFCKQEIPRRLLPEHRSLKCLQRPYWCKFCSSYKSTYTDVTENHFKVCGLAPVQCPNKCTTRSMPRRELEQHISECPEGIAKCEFESVGCSYSGLRKNLNQHNKEKISEHIILVAQHETKQRQTLMMKMENELQRVIDETKVINQRNTELYQENARFKEEVKTLKMEVKTLKHELHVQKESFENRLAQEVVSLREECLKTIQEGKDASAQETSKRINDQVKKQVSGQMASIKREIKQENVSFVAELNKDNDRKLQESFGLVFNDTQALKNKTETLRKDVDGLKAIRRSSAHGETALLEKKIEVLEDLANITLPSQIGKQLVELYLREFYKWKVSNDEWISPQFYLGGYKFCLTAFVNGDIQQGAEGFFSLYAHLMKGENDEKLSFPFQRTLTLELVHKYNEANNKKQILPYSSSMHKKYNGRVTGSDSKAKGWGFARFISHGDLPSFFHGNPERLIIQVSIT